MNTLIIMENITKMTKERLSDQELLTRYFLPTKNAISSSGYILHYSKLITAAQYSDDDDLSTTERNFLQMLAEDENLSEDTAIRSYGTNSQSKKRKKRADRWRRGSESLDSSEAATSAKESVMTPRSPFQVHGSTRATNNQPEHHKSLNASLEKLSLSHTATQCDLYPNESNYQLGNSSPRNKDKNRQHPSRHVREYLDSRKNSKDLDNSSSHRGHRRHRSRHESNQSEKPHSCHHRKRHYSHEDKSSRIHSRSTSEICAIDVNSEREKLGRNMRAKERKTSRRESIQS